MTRSFSIRGVDGNDLTVSETVEGQEIVISVRTEGTTTHVRLDEDQWSDLCGLKYDIKFKQAPAPPPAPYQPVEPKPLEEVAF